MLIFYFFAAIQLFFGYKSLRGGFDYWRYFRDELAKSRSDYQPFASVIVPCRGIEEDLELNLQALYSQKYSDYEIVFVVDSEKDASVLIIEKLIAENRKSTLVVAGKATDCGQKVHNLRTAVSEVSSDSKVLVFVDSDARPRHDWLSNLIAPLENKQVGCSTGYRWFVQKRGGFSTHLRAAWNASIASALGEKVQNNFCWGGSTAIKRSVFEKLDVKKKWKGTLSDDFALTNIMKEAKLGIHFVPKCLTATIEDTSFSELLEFTTRQIKITRAYSPNLWAISFVSAALFTFTFWGGILLLFFTSGIHFRLASLFLTLIFVLGISKVWLRLKAVKLVLVDYGSEINWQFLWHSVLWIISPILFLYNNFRALISRRIVWRGIEYELESSNRTKILAKDG